MKKLNGVGIVTILEQVHRMIHPPQKLVKKVEKKSLKKTQQNKNKVKDRKSCIMHFFTFDFEVGP